MRVTDQSVTECPGYGRTMISRRVVASSLACVLVAAGCASSDDDGAVADTTDAPAEASTPATDAPADTEAPAATDAPVETEAPPATDTPPETEAPPDTEAPPEPASYDFAAIEPLVADFVEAEGLNGAGLIIVDADDGVVLERYWGEFGPDRISLVASSSKMITAGVLLRLQDDGLLDINAPITEVTGWEGNPDITTAQLLSNSSGLVGLGPDPGYAPYLCQFLPDGDIEDCGASIFETPDDDGDILAPDTEFRYGGAQWQLAGAVAETVSGKTWTELIDEIYIEPCGLEALGFNNHFTQIPSGFSYPVDFGGDPSTLAETDNPNMEGGAYVTTGDYAKLLSMHLRGGMCGENQVLSQEALDTMHADRVAAAYGGDASENTGYGMGWWVDRETGRISDGGAYGSVPWLDLDDGYGAYLVIESDSGTGGTLAGLIEEPIADAIAAAG